MVVEKKKYIIELPENTHWIQWIMESTKDHHPYMDYKKVEYLTPYTEPDLEQVRKEAYQLFQYSNYTIQKIFGYDTAREVVKHFEESEIVARIRCYEGGVKQDLETIRNEAYKKGVQDTKDSITVEDVMRQYLDAFCKHNFCTECILHTSDFTCGRGRHFLTSSPVSNEEVRKAYTTVLQKMKEE